MGRYRVHPMKNGDRGCGKKTAWASPKPSRCALNGACHAFARISPAARGRCRADAPRGPGWPGCRAAQVPSARISATRARACLGSSTGAGLILIIDHGSRDGGRDGGRRSGPVARCGRRARQLQRGAIRHGSGEWRAQPPCARAPGAGRWPSMRMGGSSTLALTRADGTRRWHATHDTRPLRALTD